MFWSHGKWTFKIGNQYKCPVIQAHSVQPISMCFSIPPMLFRCKHLWIDERDGNKQIYFVRSCAQFKVTVLKTAKKHQLAKSVQCDCKTSIRGGLHSPSSNIFTRQNASSLMHLQAPRESKGGENGYAGWVNHSNVLRDWNIFIENIKIGRCWQCVVCEHSYLQTHGVLCLGCNSCTLRYFLRVQSCLAHCAEGKNVFCVRFLQNTGFGPGTIV